MSKFILFLSLVLAANYATAASEADLIKKSYDNDYYSQRNLAYSYATGWGAVGDKDYIQKNQIKACAWYKTILITQPDKSDSGDLGNVKVYCKPLSKEDLSLADKLSINQIDKIKAKK